MWTLTKRNRGGRVALAIHRCRKPSIAAVQGPAIRVFFTFSSFSLMKVADRNNDDSLNDHPPRMEGAKIVFVFSQRGVVIEAAPSFFIPISWGMHVPYTSPPLARLFWLHRLNLVISSMNCSLPLKKCFLVLWTWQSI